MDAMAELADRFGHGDLRNIGVAASNIGLVTNIGACPRGGYCALTDAASFPVAEVIERRPDFNTA